MATEKMHKGLLKGVLKGSLQRAGIFKGGNGGFYEPGNVTLIFLLSKFSHSTAFLIEMENIFECERVVAQQYGYRIKSTFLRLNENLKPI